MGIHGERETAAVASKQCVWLHWIVRDRGAFSGMMELSLSERAAIHACLVSLRIFASLAIFPRLFPRFYRKTAGNCVRQTCSFAVLIAAPLR